MTQEEFLSMKPGDMLVPNKSDRDIATVLARNGLNFIVLWHGVRGDQCIASHRYDPRSTDYWRFVLLKG